MTGKRNLYYYDEIELLSFRILTYIYIYIKHVTLQILCRYALCSLAGKCTVI